ncbi:hypothetical protein diail_1923 [Diaporthe ilicicola]|nr:hypothetical protein diail_1923 [Diaporthe ilicicola]
MDFPTYHPKESSADTRKASFSSIFSVETAATSAGGADNDPYNLERFIKAQDRGDAFNKIVADFRGGHRKPQPATWMWFVFPQMDHCQTRSLRLKLSYQGAVLYEEKDRQAWMRRDVWPRGHSLASLDEARAYLAHPVLGRRIREAADAVFYSEFADRFSLMDNISMDVARLHSSMTIFRQAARFPLCIHDKKKRGAHENSVFAQVINRFFVSFDTNDEEDVLLDAASLEKMSLKRGSRHKPTLEHLDELEKVDIEQRLRRGVGCVCGREIGQLKEMDKDTKRKMDMSQAAVDAERRRVEKARAQKKKQQQETGADVGKCVSSLGGPAALAQDPNLNIDPRLLAYEDSQTRKT